MDNSESTPPRMTECSKPWCHVLLALNDKKACPKCREADRKNQKAKTARDTATVPPATTESRKRRPSGTTGGSDDRPAVRPRTDDTSPNSDNESDDDGKSVDFHGTYKVAVNPLVTPKERVQMVAAEIWKIAGYRFTVKDNRELKGGHRTRLWCCQDEARTKKSKASHDPNVRNRNNVGMKRYPLQLKHAQKHTSYTDVSMPAAALDLVRENVEWLTPVAMVSKVQAKFPTVTAAQIHQVWMKMSEIHWRRDNLQLPSAAKMLEEHGDEVDIFKPENVPEDVEMLCWGMKKIAGPLRGKIYDNSGFPLSYLFLSTASSIDQGKRRKAFTAWATCLRDAYRVTARFTHVDKDRAEIGMLKDIWNAKISLCWWHLRCAVGTRLASAKLATTPYDLAPANAEFSFIDVRFILLAQADGDEYEGGFHDKITPVVPASERRETRLMPNGLRITVTIPASQLPPPSVARDGTPPAIGRSKPLATAEPHKPKNLSTATQNQATRRGREVKAPARTADAADPAELAHAMNARVGDDEDPNEAAASSEDSEAEEEKPKARRTFCHASYREPIINILERHFCAHPLLPGSAPPSPVGIRRWAVTEMYKFCVENRLPEVLAYLWENWYRKSRWELWACSVHPKIPVLKTTMILESHWRRIKHDFLHHFHIPRCDLLAWILIVKLLPHTGHYRELPSWRKGFKKVWRKLEKTPITIPVNPAHKTDTTKIICTCPSLATSRFLICKHTVQGMKPVPPVFFLEVKCQRTAPFWVHPLLRPLSDNSGAGTNPSGVEEQQAEVPLNNATDSNEENDGDDDEDDLIDTQIGVDQPTFLEVMDEKIETVAEFLKGLRYQRQFRDQRMLQTLEREGTSFFRLAKVCLRKEKRLTSTRGEAPSTWDPSTSSAMFYRARPARGDENT
ncbi:hypothetical protein C8R45DRAFT_1163371 [Mycena sanguinolenta]|nr:hypothetical protein C8R45DRAFT_1163371 [Mycena sanguinolenta]